MSSESSVKLLPLGASLQEFNIAGKNIVLGFNDPEEYKHNPAFFGNTIGRVANRIKNASLTLPTGTYKLAANNGVNALHGGPNGWHYRNFKGPEPFSKNGKESARFTYTSEHNEEGYPGKLDVKIEYTSYEVEENGTKKTVLEIDQEAKLADDSEADVTAVNITNHSYFNIGDKETIEGTEVTLASHDFMKVDAGGIPDGKIEHYPGVDAGKAFTLGPVEPDIDDCFVFTDSVKAPLDTRSLPVRKNAEFYHPSTKYHLIVSSSEPAYQFYTGKFIDVEARKDGPRRGKLGMDFVSSQAGLWMRPATTSGSTRSC